MPLLSSTGLRNKVLDTGSVKSVLANGFIHVYASTLANIPATADAAINPANHTLLLTVYGDGISAGLNLGTASGGAIGKDPGETWAGHWQCCVFPLCRRGRHRGAVHHRAPLPGPRGRVRCGAEHQLADADCWQHPGRELHFHQPAGVIR